MQESIGSRASASKVKFEGFTTVYADPDEKKEATTLIEKSDKGNKAFLKGV